MSDSASPGAESVELRVSRPDLVAWLDSLPAGERNVRAEQALAVGYQALTFIQASASEESMQRMFRPVVDDMEKLRGLLERMVEGTQKSQRLGDIGERTVASQLQAAFPSDRFEIISDEGHQADVRATFDLGDGVERSALVEVKLYTNDVNKGELEKFRYDLRAQRQRYGLMVSLTSRLAGMSGPFVVETDADYVAVFVPSAGLDGVRLYWAAAFVKALMTYEHRAGQRLRGDAVAEAWARLQGEFGELEACALEIGKFREGLRRARENVDEALDSIADQASAADVRMRHLIQRLQLRMHEELAALPQAPRAELPSASAPDRVAEFLVALDDAKDKRAPAFRALAEVAAANAVEIAIDPKDGTWALLPDGKLLAETCGTRTELRVSWCCAGEKSVTIDTACETYKEKEGRIEIRGKEAAVVARRVAERIGFRFAA